MSGYTLPDIDDGKPFAYLAVIGRLAYGRTRLYYPATVVTLDDYTDKAVEAVAFSSNYPVMCGRHADPFNEYHNYLYYSGVAADHEFRKVVGGTITSLGVEGVDIGAIAHILCLSCEGSTIKSLRYEIVSPVKSIRDVTPTATLSTTDTDLTSGRFGVVPKTGPEDGICDTLSARLIPPQTSLPRALGVAEFEVKGDGSDEAPFKPSMLEEIVEVREADVTPEEWVAVQGNPKGVDELPLVNRLSVTWGAFDYKGEATMVVTIRRGMGSYLDVDAVLKQSEKAVKSWVVKDDIAYLEDIHKQLKRDRPEMIAGRHNFLYQTLGYEDFEPLAVADFYDGFVQGIYDMKDLERVSRDELDATINMWLERLKKTKVSATEKRKHEKKLRGVLRR